MLVLTRRIEERIRIGRDITITILRIKGNSAKVGIEAPAGVPVVRCELLEKDALHGDASEQNHFHLAAATA